MFYLSLIVKMIMNIANCVGIRLVKTPPMFMMDMLIQLAFIGYVPIAIKISKTYSIGRYQMLVAITEEVLQAVFPGLGSIGDLSRLVFRNKENQ